MSQRCPSPPSMSQPRRCTQVSVQLTELFVRSEIIFIIVFVSLNSLKIGEIGCLMPMVLATTGHLYRCTSTGTMGSTLRKNQARGKHEKSGKKFDVLILTLIFFLRAKTLFSKVILIFNFNIYIGLITKI